MPNRDPRRALATLETCDTYIEHGVCTCWPKCEPSARSAPDIDYWGLTDAPDPDDDDDDDVAVLDQLATFELRVHELRCLVAGYDDERLAKLPAAERRLIEETALHLVEYDRAKRGEGGHG
jgi:hypothetical protein